MASLPPYMKPPEEWTAERVTARDVVPYRDVTLFIWCDGCRRGRELNVWTIGARLADDPLREVRFRCRACGVYPSGMQISRRTSSAPEKLLMISLKPRFWDDGHREDQAAALLHAEARRNAKGGA